LIRRTPRRRLARHAFLAAALCGLAFFAAPADAGEVAVYGSYWDTSDLAESAGAGVKLGLGSGLLGFEARLGYYPDLTEDFDDVIDEGFEDDLDFEVEVKPVDVGITLNFLEGQALQPFVVGGGSYYVIDTNVLDVDDEFGYYFGGGVRFGGGGLGFFVEGLYRQIEGSVNGDIDDPGDINDVFVDEFDLDLSGLNVNAGLSWRF